MELSKGRDLRKRGWFWLDDEYLNGYARHLGTTATCVYLCLCRHADKDQTCFPKLETIAKEIGAVKNTVIKAIKKLEQWSMIEITKEYDSEKKRQKVNVYLLLDKLHWKPKPDQSADIAPSIPECIKSEEQGANKVESRVQPLSRKETHINNTQLRNTPHEQAKSFFLMVKENNQRFASYLASLNYPENLTRPEIEKFTLYWTELNSTGTKERWEKEPTFEVLKRLRTWFNGAKGFKGQITSKYKATSI